MMFLVSALIALSTVSTFKIPGAGSLELPPGCAAPDLVKGTDSVMGFITCEGRSVINFDASPAGPSPCPPAVRVSLQSLSGAPLQMCVLGRGGEKGRVERMYVDLGVGVLTMEVKSSQDVMHLLKLASSLQIDRKQ